MTSDLDAESGLTVIEARVIEEGAESATAVESVDDEMLAAATRLLVGALVEGSVQFKERLERWDVATAVADAAAEPGEKTAADQLRYTLIGMLFHAQAQVKTRQIPFFKRASGAAFHSFNRIAGAFIPHTVSRSVNGRVDAWAAKGETRVKEWMATGQREEAHGRQLAALALQESIDEFIKSLAENKELQDLITEQSMSLAAESMDSVRERTVTGDALAERFVRTLLRLPPRTATLAPANSSPEEE